MTFRVPPGNTVGDRRIERRGQVDVSRILFRFTTWPAAAWRIDGQDIRDVTQKSLRAAIGVVPQDTVLFNDTIYYKSPTAGPAPAARRSSRRPAWRASMTSSWPCRSATRRRSANAG